MLVGILKTFLDLSLGEINKQGTLRTHPKSALGTRYVCHHVLSLCRYPDSLVGVRTCGYSSIVASSTSRKAAPEGVERLPWLSK